MKMNKAKRKVAVAPVNEFPPGERVEIKVGKINIAVFNVKGEYFAIFGICPHQSAPLSRGRLQGTVVAMNTQIGKRSGPMMVKFLCVLVMQWNLILELEKHLVMV